MSKSNFAGIALFIGNNDKKLIAQTLNGLDFVNDVRVMRNASLNGTGLQKMTVAKGIRPLNTNVTEREGAQRSFSGRKLMVYGGMKIIDIIPEEAYNTWMSDMLVPGAKDIPFAQWVWEQEFAKIGSEINDSIHFSDYKGNASAWLVGSVYTGGTDYVTYGPYENIYKCVTTTTAGQSPDTHPAKWLLVNESVISTGWGTIIANEISGGGIPGSNIITTGTLTSSNTLDKVEAMIKAMPEAHRKLGGEVKMSTVSFDKYLDQEKTVYPAALNQNMGAGQKSVYGHPNWKIKPVTWMNSSSRLIATQKENLVFGCNLESDMNKAGKTIETLHGYKTAVKWIQGCEIADLETLYVNDQQ